MGLVLASPCSLRRYVASSPAANWTNRVRQPLRKECFIEAGLDQCNTGT